MECPLRFFLFFLGLLEAPNYFFFFLLGLRRPKILERELFDRFLFFFPILGLLHLQLRKIATVYRGQKCMDGS